VANDEKSISGTALEGDELRPAPMWANVVASVTRRLPRGKSRAIGQLGRRSSARFLGKMSRQLGGCVFDCSLRDRLAREVFFAGCAAIPEIAFLRAVLQPGMSFVDVGANWGLFTLVGTHLVGATGTVAALEPDPRVFTRLKSNVRRNGLRQVQLFAVAAADRDSQRVLAPYDAAGDNWETSRLVEDGAPAQNTLFVPARRLDPLLDEIGLDTVDLLKIDVEGAEDLVLSGMEEGLNNYRYRRILLELHPLQLAERHKTSREVADMLRAREYRGFVLDYSPSGARRAYYHPWRHFLEYIRPLEPGILNGPSHTVWLCPGQPDLT
jgi:FkbM family methyltransferase